ncbi:MAG: hypothetical protein ACK5MA_01280 [Parachlamydiaceae bacterium]
MIVPFHIIVSSAKKGSDECVYVQSPHIKIFDNTIAKLTFLPCDNPLSEKQNLKWTEHKKNFPENTHGRFEVRRWMKNDTEFDNIKKVEVALFTPCYGAVSNPDKSIKEEKRIWTALVPLIVQLCQELFPNMDNNESAFVMMFADKQVFACEKNFSEPNSAVLWTSQIF